MAFLDLSGLQYFYNKVMAKVKHLMSKTGMINLLNEGFLCDGVTDESEKLNALINNAAEGDCIYLPAGYTLCIASDVAVSKNVHFVFKGDLLVKNCSMVFGATSAIVQFCEFTFNNIIGKGDGTALFLRNARHNRFNIMKISNFNKGICLDAQNDTTATLGQNIFNFMLIEKCDYGIVFEGNDTWASAVWAEGNQFQGGFVANCSYGLYFNPNIKSGCTIFYGAIDCVEADGQDIVDNSTGEPDYYSTNLIISNFFRLSASSLKPRNTYIEPAYGINSAADIKSMSQILVDDNNGNLTSIGKGNVELCSAVPYIDFKNSSVEDRDSRIISQDNALQLSSGGGDSDSFSLINNKVLKLPSGARGVAVPANTSSVVVEFNESMGDNFYNVFITPSWATGYGIIAKGGTYFTVQFTSAPETAQTFDYFLTRVSQSLS